jgi:transcriptional regulator with XRE-family HTH domain
VSDKDQRRREIGNRIKQLRVSREYTLQELAEKAKMSAGYLSEIERGVPALSGEKLGALAAALGTNVDYILTGTGAPEETHGVQIPAGLAEAAEILDLSYAKTSRLLAGKKSLVAARRDKDEEVWTAQEWIDFYNKVARYL